MFKIKKNNNTKVSLIISGIVLIFLAFLTMNVLNANVSIENDKIKASGLFGFSLAFEEIKNVEIIENVDIIIKLNGAGIGKTHKGVYRIREYGNAKLYINNKDLKYNILITSNEDKYFILNLDTLEETENIFKELSSLK
ncbi:MAG: PH domain-containing protein [Thermotogota bacterium]